MKNLAVVSLVVAFCRCSGGATHSAPVPVVSAPAVPAAPAPAQPLFFEGKLATIRGRYVSEGAKLDYYSKNMTQNLFDVTSIDGKPVSLRAELVDPPTLLAQAKSKDGELTLVGYFYRAVSTGSLVEGFDPPGTQGHAFSYALKFKVKPPSK